MGSEGEALIGRTLGDFVVRDQIGAGGFGAVYRAEQPLLGREAVIKVPLAPSASSAEYVARFLREARLASKLDHPYAAHIYAFGSEPDGTLWTAMELVRGTPLDRVVEQQGPLPLERFAPLFDKICEVVQTAHEQGIIHRDLKPSNVMVLARAGRLLPKLLDLGIAKGDGGDGRASDAGTSPGDDEATDEPALAQGSGARYTRAGKYLGSPAYMAPEQWVDASRADARTDVYALGILAFEVLTGRLPFSAPTTPGIARLHARAPVPALPAHLPAALHAVIARAMAKRPDDRFPSALELAAAMRAAAGLDGAAPRLPELDPFLRDELLTSAPQPLAEAVAAFDSVRNVHQAQGAVFAVVRVVVRLIGNLALACWCEVAARVGGDQDDLQVRLRQLRQRGLSDPEWIELAQRIAGRVSALGDGFALPELIELLAPGDGATTSATDELAGLLTLRGWFEQHPTADEATTLAQLGKALPLVDKLLRRLTWLGSYPLVVVRAADGRADVGEPWMGVRRLHRATVPVRGALADAGGRDALVLIDQNGAVVVPLSPLVQLARPAPGHGEEMFVLDGAGKGGARLVSLPTGFERTDDALWPWMRARVGLDADERAQAAEQRPPYRGLATFTRDDADQFVGREQETEAFANRLRVTPLLVVVGPSGAGKSSFVQAGVVPALGPSWTTIIVRPGPSPLTALRAGLVGAGVGIGAGELDGDGVRAALRGWAQAQQHQVLLYVDQFEEVFTLCHDPGDRARYVDTLVGISRLVDDPIRVVLTVRDDFLLRCQQVGPLRERLATGLQLLATPTAEDLGRILTEPARRAGYEFEDPELPAEMVSAVADQAAALPLLSFTAAQMWDLRDRHAHRLTRKAYETLGGVGGALAQHAERVFGQMSADERQLVRVGFRNLVTADGTRAVLTRAEMLELLGDARTGESVIEKLIGARLLTGSEGVGGIDRVEVVHEALLSGWPRLIDWRREDAEGARLRDQLRAAARQWEERGRPRGLLWRAETLTEYQLWRARHPGLLTAVEQQFGDASERDAARGRRLRNGAIGTILAILTVGLVVALVLYRDAETQRVRAASNERRAVAGEGQAKDAVTASNLSLGQRAAVAGDASAALVYLTAARAGGASGAALEVPLATARQVFAAERLVQRGHDKKIWAMVPLGDGTRFASAGSDGVVNLWSVDQAAPLHVLRDARDGIFNLSASPDGALLAAPSFDGRARLYRVATGELVHTLVHGDSRLFVVMFGPDGRRVYLADDAGTISVWDLPAGRKVGQHAIPGGSVGLPALSPDGRTMAVPGFDGSLRLIDPDTGAVRTFIPHAHADTTWAVAFSADGALLATAGWDRTAKLWDARTGAARATMVGHSAAIDDVVWSPSGKLLATGARDGTIRVWNRDGSSKATLSPDRGLVYSVRWGADDTRVLTTIGDSAILWDVDAALPLARFAAQGAAVFRAFTVPGRDEVVSAGGDGTIRRWTSRSTTQYRPTAHAGIVTRVAACTGGPSWLTVGADGKAIGWSRSGEVVWTSPAELVVSDAACRGGRWLLAAADGVLHEVDVSAPDPRAAAPRRLDLPALGAGATIELAPDGARLLAVAPAGPAQIVSLVGGPHLSLPGELPAIGNELIRFWLGDGSAVVYGTDGGARVWDTRTGALRFSIDPPGGVLRALLSDLASGSLFVVGQDYTIGRRALTDGRELGRYAGEAYPWMVAVRAGHVFAGMDDGSVTEFDLATGRKLGLVGLYGADVINLSFADDDLLLVGGMNRVLTVVDRTSAAVLLRVPLPSEARLVTAADGQVAVGGLSGAVTFVTLARDRADVATLEREAACRVPFTLEAGVRVPRPIDPRACQGVTAPSPTTRAAPP
ncbi:MAG: protein kinase [Kofleriaceae bacterium]|nr:protein kinase [Kofleriaceae bacterium]MBP6837084.1 protein kinase [Kofleriaceae bacterium]MBP9202931.1 protein kinase [Kofleriaceae bacterium]